ncbi:hypothetical protein RJ639_045926 [Escallonia herrerae]|uniref:AAA+ ATPase domain-containing protein n=1 Tax=Escallonia herrerae TaxID=1293975 RepID=A0AA89B218_9ASTE|nr:hypothetical protein RJ639_045926 [Escallonia herrerae]
MALFSYENMPASKAVLSVAASLTASAVLFRTMADDLIPDYFYSPGNRYCSSNQLTVVIEEFQGLTPNHMFEAANIYLGTKVSPSTRRIKVNKPEKDEELVVTVDRNQEIVDIFQGVEFKWGLESVAIKQLAGGDRNPKPRSELRYFQLSVLQKHKEMVLKAYLPHILQKASAIKRERKAVRLHTVDYNGTDYWSSVPMNHLATFDTMAMEPEKKRELIKDLERFISRKEYYRAVGKAWKRGYLFHGPPGTGKSTLVAAMANYLRFDVYDLDLREVQCNSDPRRLLIGTANRSILVIEDIDCNVGITLSGLHNFIDGLWSSCGDERIIVCTTNHKDQLDPALLQPEMSYCTFSGFKILASNYLKMKEHPLFEVIKDLFMKVQVTPAEVAGELMKSDDAETALQSLIKTLQSKESMTKTSIGRVF